MASGIGRGGWVRDERGTGGRREVLWTVLVGLFGLATLVLLIIPGILAA